MAQVGDINSRTTTHVVCPTHHDWWCSGDLSNQCISRHGIDNQSRNIPSPAWEELINDWYTEHFRESAPRWTSQDFTNGNSTMTGGDISNQLTLQLPSPVDPMETFSVLLALCAGNSPVPGEFPAQGPVTRCVDVFFDLRLNKRLSKQSAGDLRRYHSCILAYSKFGRPFGSTPSFLSLMQTKMWQSYSILVWYTPRISFDEPLIEMVWNCVSIVRIFIDLPMLYATKTMEHWLPNVEYGALWRDVTTTS